MSTIRMDPERRERIEAEAAADVKIMQKVNRAHGEAFAERYPGQVEHSLRLVMERLQAGLDKRDGIDVARPATWRVSAAELAALSTAAYYLHQLREDLKLDQ